ncbi:(2Fe-2S)-binding protein [Micromonospora sp. NPDC018662]|uniref:(2Fe-2S)-binding protein n=1 Tax=Micromonospora sp. NPDC018662 TaxID=3364238 RepID=UPI0037903A68
MDAVELVVNGVRRAAPAEPRRTLADFLREELGLTGTHVGCEQGACGACTVLLDGEPVYACLMFAVQARGHEITTVEGLAPPGELGPVQEAFRRCHAVQCGFCTPGMVLAAHALLADEPTPDEPAIRAALAGNLCRCTGYQSIVDAVRLAAARRPDPAAVPGTEGAAR